MREGDDTSPMMAFVACALLALKTCASSCAIAQLLKVCGLPFNSFIVLIFSSPCLLQPGLDGMFSAVGRPRKGWSGLRFSSLGFGGLGDGGTNGFSGIISLAPTDQPLLLEGRRSIRPLGRVGWDFVLLCRRPRSSFLGNARPWIGYEE